MREYALDRYLASLSDDDRWDDERNSERKCAKPINTVLPLEAARPASLSWLQSRGRLWGSRALLHNFWLNRTTSGRVIAINRFLYDRFSPS